MVYHNQFVAAIKSNGKILRESNNNTIYIPFDSTYEIIFKNLNSRDALVDISIDGQDVLDNNHIIVRANSSGSLEGFLKDNKVTNKFKFIRKTNQISNYRGDFIDDGIIRIEYRFAQIKPITITYNRIYNPMLIYHPLGCPCPICNPPVRIVPYYPYSPIITCSSTVTNSVGSNNQLYSTAAINPDVENIINNQANDVAGITVKGPESNQNFDKVNFIENLEENSHVIILNLRGVDEKTKQPIQEPVLVKRKITCPICGVSNKSRYKFCSNCGTALF